VKTIYSNEIIIENDTHYAAASPPPQEHDIVVEAFAVPEDDIVKLQLQNKEKIITMGSNNKMTRKLYSIHNPPTHHHLSA
jgi:hypothetical protein